MGGESPNIAMIRAFVYKPTLQSLYGSEKGSGLVSTCKLELELYKLVNKPCIYKMQPRLLFGCSYKEV